jgi:hypothetical protein
MQSIPAIGRLRFLRSSVLLAAFAFVALLFYRYCYNSTYGFDALEYLIIARSLVRGYRLFAFVPSKSWALYSVVGAAFWLGLPQNHVGISALICGIFVVLIFGTYYASYRLYGSTVALVHAALVSLCAVFMEMNFLQPESLVYLAALCAFCVLTSYVDGAPAEQRLQRWLAAGLLLAVGWAFKSIAGFYLLGVVLFAFPLGCEAKPAIVMWMKRTGTLLAGFSLAALPPAGYFWWTGRGAAYFQWCITFPLLHYPRTPVYLGKVTTKLLWLLGLALVSLLLSLRKSVWSMLRRDRGVQLALCMGLASLLALTKNQSSHYFFPGAAFLCLCMARVLVLFWQQSRSRRSALALGAVGAGCGFLICMGVYLYAYRPVTGRNVNYAPGILRRFRGWRDYSEEKPFVMVVQKFVGPGESLLAFRDGERFYWLGDRLPNIPVINTAEQTTWWVEHNPKSLAAALDDGKLALVEYNPGHVELDDADPNAIQHWRSALAELEAKLAKQFCPVMPSPIKSYVFWTRAQARSAEGEPVCTY